MRAPLQVTLGPDGLQRLFTRPGGAACRRQVAGGLPCSGALACRHWWGVSEGVVIRWRKALGVDRVNCPGSQRLVRAASAKGADHYRGKKLPPEQVERRRRTARELGLRRHLRPGYNLGPWWSPAEVRLLGKLPDEDVAAKVGRSPDAVRQKRQELGIPNPRDRRRRC
jgi:hypothetical protein